MLEAVQRLRPVADQAGLSLTTLALAWVLWRTEVVAAIVSASHAQQVFDNAAAFVVKLSAHTLAAIDAMLGDAVMRDSVLAVGAEAGVMHRRSRP